VISSVPLLAFLELAAGTAKFLAELHSFEEETNTPERGEEGIFGDAMGMKLAASNYENLIVIFVSFSPKSDENFMKTYPKSLSSPTKRWGLADTSGDGAARGPDLRPYWQNHNLCFDVV
jgi:hypothetical protein